MTGVAKRARSRRRCPTTRAIRLLTAVALPLAIGVHRSDNGNAVRCADPRTRLLAQHRSWRPQSHGRQATGDRTLGSAVQTACPDRLRHERTPRRRIVGTIYTLQMAGFKDVTFRPGPSRRGDRSTSAIMRLPLVGLRHAGRTGEQPELVESGHTESGTGARCSASIEFATAPIKMLYKKLNTIRINSALIIADLRYQGATALSRLTPSKRTTARSRDSLVRLIAMISLRLNRLLSNLPTMIRRAMTDKKYHTKRASQTDIFSDESNRSPGELPYAKHRAKAISANEAPPPHSSTRIS